MGGFKSVKAILGYISLSDLTFVPLGSYAGAKAQTTDSCRHPIQKKRSENSCEFSDYRQTDIRPTALSKG